MEATLFKPQYVKVAPSSFMLLVAAMIQSRDDNQINSTLLFCNPGSSQPKHIEAESCRCFEIWSLLRNVSILLYVYWSGATDNKL